MLKRKIANRYQLEEQVKEEKLYTVYRGTDTKENKPVSISVLSEIAMKKPLENLLRYRKIQENLKSLNHFNLLRNLEVGEEEGNIFVISEEITGKSLENYEGLSTEEKIKIIARMAETLELTHQYKLHHGNINCSNILIGKDKTPKLIGFGLNLLLHCPS